jgi:CBS domain containing-hemolysin-like protein
MIGVAAIIVAALLAVSAVLTAVHDAAFQIARSHVRTLLEEGFDGAEALTRVRENASSVQAGIRIVTQTLDLAALAIIILMGVSVWQGAGPVLNAVAAVVLVVAVADLIPRVIAARRPVRLALSASSILLVVERLTRPVTAPVERLEERIGSNGDARTDQHRELREIQAIGAEEGVLVEGENRLVERAFRLDETTAWDVMVPRVDIFAWNEERTLAEVIDELQDVPYSRVPVFRESVDDVTGIVYVREAYARWAKGERDLPLARLAREPFFVPGSLSLTQLLQAFQARRIHMGIVADEFGGTDGLVTLEDVLEELVGDIQDETDREEDDIVHVSEGILLCDAGVDLRDLVEELDVPLPETEHRSLNGFILDELGHVPAEGHVLEVEGVRIEIVEASETQVLRARLTRIAPPSETED